MMNANRWNRVLVDGTPAMDLLHEIERTETRETQSIREFTVDVMKRHRTLFAYLFYAAKKTNATSATIYLAKDLLVRFLQAHPVLPSTHQLQHSSQQVVVEPPRASSSRDNVPMLGKRSRTVMAIENRPVPEPTSQRSYEPVQPASDVLIWSILQVASKIHETRENHLGPKRIRELMNAPLKLVQDSEVRVLQQISYNVSPNSTSFQWTQVMLGTLWAPSPAPTQSFLPGSLDGLRRKMHHKSQDVALDLLISAMLFVPDMFIYSGKTIAASCVYLAMQITGTENTKAWTKRHCMFLFL